MRELDMLWEQARVLRDLAERSTDKYGIKEKLLALAQQCDELAREREKALNLTKSGH